MELILAPIIVNISTCLYSRLRQQLDYLKRERENVENLVTQQEELSSREKEVLMEIENVKMQTGKKVRSQVTVWLKSVEKVTKEVHEIEFKSREATGCCKGCFPNCFLRSKLSKQAAKKIKVVSELLQKGRFTDGLFGNLSESRMTLPTSTLLDGTAEKTKEKIWECLMDVNVAVLGVYGTGEVGKTTIMTHIYNQLIEDSIFDSVIWVTVSKTSTLEQLQNNIAKSLDLELSKEADEMRRSQELFAAFKRRKKFVLFLDDMWIAFPLEKVGIPKPDQENGCKLVLTTQLLDVCRAMESQREINVEILTEEEAWKLFKDKVGHDFSHEVEEIAKLFLRECGGLPLAPKKSSHAESSSSQSTFDHNRFPSLGKAKQFQEQYQSKSVESEREVAEELHDKLVFRSLATRNWFSLVKFKSSKIYVDWVREFYNNMEIEDNGDLKTFVRGKWITVSTDVIADIINIPVVENSDYPIPANTQINYDDVATTICGAATAWLGGILPHENLTAEYQFLNRFVCHNLEPRGHTSDVSHKNGYLLYCIGTGKSVNIPQVIMNAMVKTLTAKKNSILPFGVLISEFLASNKEVPKKPSDITQKIRNPINSHTLALSTAHVPHAPQGDEVPEEVAAPVQGKQQAPHDRIDQLAAQMQGLTTHIDA